MTHPPLDFFTAYHIAETAARVLCKEHPKKCGDLGGLDFQVASNLRIMARRSAVATLRWLWRTGTAEQRRTVACRVAVWVRQAPGVNDIGARVQLREEKRLNLHRRIAA
jgi:hypothetical protein